MIYKINHSYLLKFSLCFVIATSLQAGWSIAENAQVGFVLEKKLNWETPNYNLITTIAANIGLGIGSLLGGIITPKLGLKNTIIICNFLGLFSNLLKQILSTETIISGRLLFGITSGILTFCMTKVLNDTVPSEVMNLYGGLINISFSFGIFASNFLGMIIPLDDEQSESKIKETNLWRIIYGMPIIFEFLGLIIVIFLFKQPSLINLVK